MPDEIIFEPYKFRDSLFLSLESKGYNINYDEPEYMGRVDAIMIDDYGLISSGADPRGDDSSSYLK